MFAPSQEQVRRFFCETWAKHQAAQPLTPLEAQACDWIAQHPEYHADLSDVEAAVSITEQVSIDQPRGIRAAVELLASRRQSLHEAHHEVMESLGEMVWESQRLGKPFDGERYIDRIRQRATR